MMTSPKRSVSKSLMCACAAALVLASSLPAAAAASGTIDAIRASNTLRIAYRTDAAPFSFADALGEPSGFVVDLCKAVAVKLKAQLNLPTLTVTYVPVSSRDRFDAIVQHKADILCEATSSTLDRRKIVDFSIATFVDGASLMIRNDGSSYPDLKSLGGQKIGVLAGTTTEQALHNSLQAGSVNAEVLLVRTHAEGLAALLGGKIAAYFADRSILQSLIGSSSDPSKLLLANTYLTVEPYALALPHGDDDFRLAVDTALSHIYTSGEIVPIFNKTFANAGTGNKLLESLYLLAPLPD
jgi:polar amino acid transport system substrate-binding protein/glutamate/aspartate transport system substrate-binding protein